MDTADLKQWALNNGKQVTLPDGTVFNADKRKVAYRRQSAKEVAPEPVAAPPVSAAAPNADIERLHDIIRSQAEQIASLTKQVRLLVEAQQMSLKAAITDRPPTVSDSPPPPAAAPAPIPFRFEVERDSDGFIKSVTATPAKDTAPQGLGGAAVSIAKRSGRG